MASGGSYPPLDLAFAIDCTGSMGSYIVQAKESIQEIANKVVNARKTDVKMALVKYRDHPPQDSTFVTVVLDFTNLKTMEESLAKANADGGGDTPEAIPDALFEVLNLSWRSNAIKMCVLVADAPPHGIGYSGDKFPQGCPLGHKPDQITEQLVTKGVIIHVISCGIPVNCESFFKRLCDRTTGKFTKLGSTTSLAEVIIDGIKEEQTLEEIIKHVEDEMKELYIKTKREKGEVSKEEIAKIMQERLRQKGVDMSEILTKNALPTAAAGGLDEGQRQRIAQRVVQRM